MTTLSNENFSFDQAESGQFENTPKSFREVLKDYLLPGQQTRGDRLALQPNYDYTSKKEQYQISISHDGKFVATLDTENLRIKVLRNTDYRGSHRKKEKDLSQQNASENIDERIALFKINNNLTVNKIYGKNETPPRFDNENNDYISNTDELSGTINNNNRFRWSLDISNMDEKFLFVAVSYIDIDEDMKCLEKRSKCQMFNYKKIKMQEATYNEKSNSYTINIPHDTQEFRKGIAIYRLRLKISKNGMEEKFILEKGYYWNNLSGICRFIENFDPTSISNKIDTPHYILTRFITLNFDGIFNFVYNKSNKNFHLNERFNYPKIIKNELKNWHTKQNLPDCMDRLVSCIYDKYFLVEHYKNNAQFLEVYDLANMKLESSAKRIVSNDNCIKKYNRNTFSIDKQKLQLCFTRGQSVEIYFMENGLEISSRNFEELEKIYFLEFIENDEKLLLIGSDENNNQNMIVWDLYNTDKIEIFRLENDLIIQNFDTHLARTSGNLLRVDNKGDITSMLKMIENKLKEETREEINKANLVEYIAEIEKEPIHKEYLYQERHTIFFFDSYEENNFRPLINETEPWVMDNYDEYSFYLCNDEIEALQLIVGRSTIQIWHKIISDPKEKEKENLPNQGNPFLEFIWTNGIPVKQEYFGIEEKMKNMEEIKGKSLKTRKVKWDDINENIMGIRYACKSLEHLNKRARSLVNYDRKHKYENMVMYINHIVWRYINHKPDQYRLLDVRHNVMKNLILGDCDHLIKFILFGSKEYETKEDKYIQADDLEPFDNEEDSKDIEEILPRNDMELAIYHCKGRELRDTIMVAYLLEYYSRHAKDYAGWMSTVSKSLPLLYKYDYDDYTRKLFRKECFADQNHFSAQDSHEIIPKKYNIKRNNNPEFKAFKPIDKLKSDRESYNSNWKAIKSVKNKVSIWLENFDNANGKPPLALRVVPLPGFTTHTIKSERVDYSLRKNIMNIIWFLLLPRWYKISRNEKDKLSPFSRVIRYENNDDMFDNPATEAVINFCWPKARNFFFFRFIRFLIFGSSFAYISWAYLVHNDDSLEFINYIIASIIVFYYYAIYFSIAKMIQLQYYGVRKFFSDTFNYFDICSILIPVIVMSIMLINSFKLSDGFENIQAADSQLVIGISFSILLIWIEVILYLRLISNIAIYIYYVLNICISIYPFLLFLLTIVIAFTHTMYILLKDPNIEARDSTISGIATSQNTNDVFNVQLVNDFDRTDYEDNPYSYFPTALEASYFWLNGNFVQRDDFDSWAVEAFTLIASIMLVTILQNILIAIMGGVYGEAATKGRQALLRFRANQIADYEALHHLHFQHQEPEPKYIYYIGQAKNFEEWYKSRKGDRGQIYKEFEEKSTFTRYNFKESSIDEVSIWKFDDKHKNDKKKEKKAEKILKSAKSTDIEEELSKGKHSAQGTIGKNDEVIDKEIQEIEQLRHDMNSLVDKLIGKLNSQKFK
ncbi:3244_t:CDS:10 [Funneliformis geosporum]|uniref:3244_t:CDS:1 n=1 Tax=Funneliformis geosporum TaxID=1117311 RepID=A0A9W4SLN5_9GLOM|nr:3244_t:CDS:10 [Funneliformis geosporum]